MASNRQAIAASLVLAVFLWGGNNTSVKYLVSAWPPIWTGCTRFLCAGLILWLLLGCTSWLGSKHLLNRRHQQILWWRAGLSLAVYIVSFNWALRFTAASHVALYLGASPVWALLAEGRPERSWRSLQRYGAAGMAFLGVLILFWPSLRLSGHHWLGEMLALSASLLWAYHGRTCRLLSSELSGVEITAHTMWRAGIWLIPLALLEMQLRPIPWRLDLVAIQSYCVLGGGVVAFGLWNNALRHWPTSQVFLFNNLIPVSTMSWAHICLGEQVTQTFLMAMLLIVGAVLAAQTDLRKLILALRPAE